MGRVVLPEPDGGDVGHETIWVEREPRSGDRVGSCLQEIRERLAMVDIECAALDATYLRAELRRRESAGSCGSGNIFRGELHKVLDRIEGQIADGLRRADLGQAAQQCLPFVVAWLGSPLRQAATFIWSSRQFHGSRAACCLCGVSAPLPRMSASQACGSTSLSLAVWITVYMAEARSAPRSEPAKTH